MNTIPVELLKAQFQRKGQLQYPAIAQPIRVRLDRHALAVITFRS